MRSMVGMIFVLMIVVGLSMIAYDIIRARTAALSRIIATALTALGLSVFGFPQHLNSVNSYAVEPSNQSSLEQQGLSFINARCTICHSSERITQQQLDRSMWTNVVDKMIKLGAPVRPEERKFLLDYLSTYYGPQRSMGSPSANTERQLEPNK